MGDHGQQHRLDVLRQHLVSAVDQGPGAGGAKQCQAGPRRQPLHELLAPAGLGQQGLYVVEQGVGDVNPVQQLVCPQHLVRTGDRPDLLEHVAAVAAGQQAALRVPVRVAQADAHQKAIQLRFRQRKGADLVSRVLGGDDEERRGQPVGLGVDRDLAFLHGFEQGALGLGRSAVDLVGQHQLREHGAGVEVEAALVAIVDGNPDHVGRQQVAGELDALVLQPQQPRQQMGQRRLADAGQVLDQQVAAGDQADQGQADGRVLAEQHFAGGAQDRPQVRLRLEDGGLGAGVHRVHSRRVFRNGTSIIAALRGVS